MAIGNVGMLLLMLAMFLVSVDADGEDTSERFKCPEGWMLKLQSCYKLGSTQMIFSDAKSECRQLGSRLRVITNEDENLLFTDMANTRGIHWLGIRRSYSGSWTYETDGTEKYLSYTNFEDSSRYSYNFGITCAVWKSRTKKWSIESCTNRQLFICQKPSDCFPGRFGENCTNQCHCSGDVCNTTSGLCKYGCQIGWKGETCDTEKQKAEAKFYCFKIQGRNVMMFRVDQKGTIYRDVSAIDEHGNTVDNCTRTDFDYFEAGRTGTLKVMQAANSSFIPDCRGTKLSSEVHSWKFRFKEYPGTSSAYESMFEVKCDFTKARTLESDTTSNTDKPANKFATLTESTLSVSLDIIDPANNLPVTTATLGQQVRLQLKLNNVDDFGVNAISPFNCSVGTLDHRHNVVFTDEHGCSPRDAQIIFLNNDVTTWRSEIFETFAFSGYKKTVLPVPVPRVLHGGSGLLQGYVSSLHEELETSPPEKFECQARG
ncbi:uncharacterized protein LOC124291086 [Haliotis rubra]|uniref:uncharacterized protein LOC124291086 n=1 Tax=Haliotis rubra TaxID=36100 RepID=UPI001EE54D3A|nr:uncharacterized protein LOC124291086 [Haliotis rubra]